MSDESARLEGPLPPAALDDPHLQPYAKHPEAAQTVAAVAMVIGFLGFVGFGIVYWIGANTQWEAATIGVGLLALGFGVTAWGKYLMPQGPFVEERHEFHSTEAERQAMTAAVTERGGIVVKRRKMLGGLFALGSTAMGVVLLFPLRSLGPKPAKSEARQATATRCSPPTGGRGRNWSPSTAGRSPPTISRWAGSSPCSPRGSPARPPTRSSSSAWPTPFSRSRPPGRTDWGVDGYVAYSKMCTHLGCPVGLYQEQTQQLVCPCHQSIFNVLAGAVPEFGPAPRPLPQLPITVDAAGYLRAKGSFDQPVGPGFWERP